MVQMVGTGKQMPSEKKYNIDLKGQPGTKQLDLSFFLRYVSVNTTEKHLRIFVSAIQQTYMYILLTKQTTFQQRLSCLRTDCVMEKYVFKHADDALSSYYLRINSDKLCIGVLYIII